MSLWASELPVSLSHVQAASADADRDREDVDSSSTIIGFPALPGTDDKKLLMDASRARTALTPFVLALPPDNVTVEAPGIGKSAPSCPPPSCPPSPCPPPPGRTTPTGTAPGTSIRRYPSNVPSSRYNPIW